ncbi:MAG TPA: biotin/lipoate A/B protein ligase family protein [Ktedonobacterales bacterium]|nr:biotin/lipoate A/B protein ligase family protein [Ktedonobacterales bacterium]
MSGRGDGDGAAGVWRGYRWQLLRPEPMDALTHMALDEVLVAEVGAGRRPPTLRIWDWAESAVVLGRFQSVRNEVDMESARRHHVHVVRRITGGGAMFVEPGNTITYSLYAPLALVENLDLVASYAYLDQWVLDALVSLGVQATYQPINDITSPAGKIGGAAQARRAGAVLHHVTMAYDIDHVKMLDILRIGREKLSDKGIASAAKRVDPLRSQTRASRETVVQRFIATFRGLYGLEDGALTRDERAQADELVATKFGTPAWLFILP